MLLTPEFRADLSYWPMWCRVTAWLFVSLALPAWAENPAVDKLVVDNTVVDNRTAEITVADPDTDQAQEQKLLRQFTSSQNGVSFHKEMFLLPITYNQTYNGDESETIYQLSFKVHVLADLYFAYTQRSFWQAYNTHNSSPFRETNYNPELFFRFAPGNALSSKLGFDLGIEHNSNGQTVPASRSWNRLYGALFYPRKHDVFYVKTWYRLPETAKATPTDSVGDDNPDITDYWGYSQWQYSRCLDGSACQQLWDIKLRRNWSTGKGAVETHWSFPSGSDQVSWYVMLFSGYGESLIDYNHAENRIGIGVTIQPK